MTDGSNRTSSLGYNSKLQPTHFEISGNLVSQDYDYYNDGRIKFVHNTTDANFDRSYFYDHSGRLTENRTGGHARNDFGQMPYYETFGYDVWSNLTSRATDTWNLQDHFEDLASYTNTRRDGWGYDADGRNTTIDTRTNTFDAAGRQVQLVAQAHTFNGTTYTATQARSHDGDGGILREITTQSNAPGTVGTVYYLKSSVLGGKIIEELASGGQKTVGYVYTSGGQRLATQSNGQVTWKHATPAGTSELQTFASISGTIRVEFDPLGADVSLTAPETSPPNEGQGDIGAGHFAGILDQRWADMFNLSGGCMIDFVATSCSLAMTTVNSGAGVATDPYEMPSIGGAYDPKTGKIIGLAVLRWDPNTGILGHYLVQSSAEADRIAQTGDWARKQVEKNYDACKKELGGSPEPGKKQAADILAVSTLESVDATLLAVTWGAEAVPGFNPWTVSNGPRGDGGWDVGPGQLSTTYYDKAPFTTGLGSLSVFGTTRSKTEAFNGNPFANLRATGRALIEAGQRSGRPKNVSRRADAAGIYRAGKRNSSYDRRVEQFNAWSKGYDDFFECLSEGPKKK